MREYLGDMLAECFDDELADTIYKITFKSQTNAYDPATGDNTQTGNDVITRGSVNTYSAKEIARSEGAIATEDLRVAILAQEITRAPVINETCDIDGYGTYRVNSINPGAFGASYLIHMSKENG